MYALEADTTLQEAAEAAVATGHSRVPVYEETIDNIIGLLYVKDLLRVGTEHEGNNGIRDLLREVYFVPEAKKVSELLREMQQREVHLVIVVDEYGGTAGLVTLEDIVEEIVGEIRDEYDEAEELQYERINPDEYLLQGRIDTGFQPHQFLFCSLDIFAQKRQIDLVERFGLLSLHNSKLVPGLSLKLISLCVGNILEQPVAN